MSWSVERLGRSGEWGFMAAIMEGAQAAGQMACGLARCTRVKGWRKESAGKEAAHVCTTTQRFCRGSVCGGAGGDDRAAASAAGHCDAAGAGGDAGDSAAFVCAA